MADLKLKKISELETWNAKELRKLRISINNRISGLDASSKPKELPKSHPLFALDQNQCKEILENVLKAERNL